MSASGHRNPGTGNLSGGWVDARRRSVAYYGLRFGGAPVVQTSEGPVQGFQTKGVTEFRRHSLRRAAVGKSALASTC